MLRKLFREVFTDQFDRGDEMALLCVLGVLTFLGLSAYVVIARGQAFDPQAFGIGLGAVIGAASAGMGLKSKLERQPEGER